MTAASALSTTKPHLSALQCPDVLRDVPAWLVWRFELTPGDDKARKIPYYPSGAKRRGVQGSPADRRQLTTFNGARAAALRRGMEGVGFCLLSDCGIVALDFDDCITGDQVHPEVERLVSGTYAERSPSGRGVRAFMRGDLGNHKDTSADGKQLHGYGLEVFSTTGFVTFTGDRLDITKALGAENTVAEVTPGLTAAFAARFGGAHASEAGAASTKPLGLSLDQVREILDALDPSMGRGDWLDVLMALHHETEASEDGFTLADEWSSGGTQYRGTEDVRGRWDSFGRNGKRPVTAYRLVQMANKDEVRINLADIEAVANDFQVLEVPAAVEKPLRFSFETASAFADGKPPGWIINGVLPRAAVGVLYGPSGSGKSFMALDLAGAIARGVAWRGRRVRQGRVAYVAAEGAGGFRNRVKAYGIHHALDLASVPLYVLNGAPNLLQKDDALEVSRGISAVGGADLVIVDTFAQVMPGANENAAEDMGKALAHCKAIHVATGALVLLVHHTGKDETRGARGWSGLKAAADAEIEVTRSGDERGARISKQKDGEDGAEFPFRLVTVAVGVDEDGAAITSCAVEHMEGAMPKAVKPGGKWQRRVLKALTELASVGNTPVALSDAIDLAIRGEPYEPGPDPSNPKRDSRRESARRAISDFIDQGVIHADGNRISFSANPQIPAI